MLGIEGLSSSLNFSCTRLSNLLNLYGTSPRVSIRKPSLTCSRVSHYQDFRDYARPLHLLPITQPNLCTPSFVEDVSTSLRGDFESVYMVKLDTSRMYGSDLSDWNAGILLCLIDENGYSILQRISAAPVVGDRPDICFQRGSTDEFAFKGPKLGRIQALWVGLESGCWRLGGVGLTILYGCQAPSENTEENNQLSQTAGLHYEFEAEDIPIGEGESMSMVELKPCHITELCGDDLLNLSSISLSRSTTLLNRVVSNQESMDEYADLKTSLLLYDVMLVVAGTSIAAISTGEKEALAFLTGGAGGFLYLLLLQKSVDGLPVPASTSTERDGSNIDKLLRQLKGPVFSLALAIAFAGGIVKYGSGAAAMEVTPQEILVGMTGFLACKVAVLLAAFKPMKIKLKENK